MSSPTAPAPRRQPVLVVIDLVVSVAVLLFAMLFGLVVLGIAAQFAGFGAACGAGPYSGLECSAVALNVATYALIAVTIVAFFLGLGMAVVRAIQRRYTFLWPVGAFVVMVAVFFLTSWIAGLTVPAA